MTQPRPLKTLLLFLVFAAAALAARAVDVPPPVKAPNDESTYRRLVLDNGLRVLLLSDPKLNKSAGSLVVNVGQIDDPADRPGLAHFLEHMLFLGTEKYPSESEYSNYLRSNGGYSNAYTATDHTNYQFEIPHAALEGAIDRFAQFFITPLFTPDFTEREINAVNNEAQRYLENDGRRAYRVRQELYDPASGESQFSTGNRDTLAGVTREELLGFYGKHYSADRMALALIGRDSLDMLEAWARKYFSGIPRRDIAAVSREQKFLLPKPALRLAKVEPIKEVRELSMEFPMGPTRPDFAAKPGELVGNLLGYEGRGSLLTYLKDEGLASGLSAGAFERTAEYGSFFVTVSLTPKGLEEHQRVLQAMFSAVALLRESPYPAQFFKERARLAGLDETFRDKGEGAALAVELANRALFFPLEIAEREPFLWLDPAEAPYRALLAAIRPDNMLAMLSAKGVPTDRSEKYFAVKYSYTEDGGDAYAALAAAPRIASITLPAENPFIPQQTVLLPLEPVAIVSRPDLQLYYLQDTEFQRPMSAFNYKVRPAASLLGMQTTVLLQYYVACVNDSVNEVAQDAALAGIGYNVSVAPDGLNVSVSGYSDSASRFLEHLAGELKGFSITDDRFAALKDRIVRGLVSFPRSETYQIAQDRKNALSRQVHATPEEQLEFAQTVTLADVRAFADAFFSKARIDGLAHGNLGSDEAVRTAESLRAKLGNTGLPDAEVAERKLTVFGAGETVVDAGKVLGNNSCMWREYIFDADTPENRAAAMVLGAFIDEPYYTEMRTKQQLGYIVWGGMSVADRQLFAYFVIQSGDYAPDELEKRSLAYLATLNEQWAGVDDATYAALVAGVRANLLEKDKTIAERAGTLFARAYQFKGDWARVSSTVASLDALTKERVGEILSQLTDPKTARVRSVLLTGREHNNATEITPTFIDRDAWKKTRKFD
ncbi:MAG TPA: insulinase family protein [Opitutaceae bacterium]